MKKRSRPEGRKGWVHPLDRAANLLESLEVLTASGAADCVTLVGSRNGRPVFTTTIRPEGPQPWERLPE